MNKAVYAAVNKRASGRCEVCSQYYGDRLELHHILRRRVKETQDNCIMICPSCHRGTFGIHGKEGHVLDKTLKMHLQRYYEALGYTEDTIRELMGGKLYLEDE